jgi:HPt (histidine-containing phosphotransfer) domain-containing protein
MTSVTEGAHETASADAPSPSVVDLLTAADVETLRGSDVTATAPEEPWAEADAAPAMEALAEPTSEAASGPEAEVVSLPADVATEERAAECLPERVAEPSTCSIEPELELAGSCAQAPESEPAGDACPSIPETGGGHAPTIDLEQLEEASMGIPSLREALLGAFLSEIRPRLDRLTRAVNAGDALRFQSEAHGLQVLSGTIGAKACANVFRELEGRGERGELEGAVVVLRSAYVEVIRAEEQAARLKEERMAA